MRECFPTSCFTRNPIPIRNTTHAHHTKSQQVCTVAPRPEQDCAIMKEWVTCTVLTCGGSVFVFTEIVFQKNGSPRDEVKRHNSKSTRDVTLVSVTLTTASSICHVVQIGMEMSIQWGHFKGRDGVEKKIAVTQTLRSLKCPPLY